jgi:DNA-binding Xre family transcriptional regulator
MTSKPNGILIIFGNIKKAQNEKVISQNRLPKMTNVAYNNIIKIKSETIKNFTIETLAKVAKLLIVNVYDLIKKEYEQHINIILKS